MSLVKDDKVTSLPHIYQNNDMFGKCRYKESVPHVVIPITLLGQSSVTSVGKHYKDFTLVLSVR